MHYVTKIDDKNKIENRKPLPKPNKTNLITCTTHNVHWDQGCRL